MQEALMETNSPPPSSSSSIQSSSSSLNASGERLFVGNLAPSVSEHDLLTLFRPHGTLRELDMIFHRTGEQRGQHKGYAFIQFAKQEQAASALRALDRKSIRGREIHINFAAAVAQPAERSTGFGPHRRTVRQSVEQDAKPTMLSRMKNLNRNDSTNSRIAAMEAKLESIRQRTTTSSSTSTLSDTSSSSSSISMLPVRPAHLPAKPGPSSSPSTKAVRAARLPAKPPSS